MARKAKATANKVSIPASILDSLLTLPEDKRDAGIHGLAVAFGSQGMDAEKIRALLAERRDAQEHEELLKGLDFSPADIVGSLPESVQDILRDDVTKRFVLTLRFLDDADGARFVLTPSIQTARGRKAKDSGGEDSED